MWNNKKSYCLSYFQSDFLFPAAQSIMTTIKAISSKGQKQRKLAYPVRTGAVSEGPEGSEQCKQASSFALPSTLLHVCLKVGMENKDHTWPLSQFWFGHKASTSKTLSWVRAVSVFHGPWITPELMLWDGSGCGWSPERRSAWLEGWSFEATPPPGRREELETEFAILWPMFNQSAYSIKFQ